MPYSNALALLLVLTGPAVDGPAAPDADGPMVALPGQRDPQRAESEWKLGAAAYSRGDFAAAIRHLEKAYRSSGRPTLLFSLAQAHRHRWESEGDSRQRHLAILRFRQYVELDPGGTRVVEAERYLAELIPLAELEGPGEPVVVTRIGVSSPTPGAIATIDGGPRLTLPATPDVPPGDHVVEVQAPGFRPAKRRVVVPAGSTISVEFPLEEVEAELRVATSPGADIYVDGERLGRAPLRVPLRLSSGPHELGVARLGAYLFVRDLELARGERTSVRADLEPTNQRRLSLAGFSLGGASLVASGVLSGLAVAASQRALALAERREAGSITLAEETHRRELVDLRDATRSAAIATGVVGAALLAASLALFFTDHPPVASTLQRRPKRARAAVVPGPTGLSFRGSF